MEHNQRMALEGSCGATLFVVYPATDISISGAARLCHSHSPRLGVFSWQSLLNKILYPELLSLEATFLASVRQRYMFRYCTVQYCTCAL